jgi:hypothetical protein
MTLLVIAEGLVILLLTVLVAGLLRSHAEILRRLHALGAGEDIDRVVPAGGRTPKALSISPVASITGVTPTGATASISLTGSRGFTLLAFLSSGCSTCKAFWRVFGSGRWEMPHQDVRIAIVTKSAVDESLSEVEKLAPSNPVTIMSTEAWDAFAVPYTPYFVLVDATRGTVVGDGAAAGWPQLLGLVDRALGDSTADPMRRTTAERLTDSDEELRRAGIDPDDPVLYRRPNEP